MFWTFYAIEVFLILSKKAFTHLLVFLCNHTIYFNVRMKNNRKRPLPFANFDAEVSKYFMFTFTPTALEIYLEE